ncbi:MAG TPA: septal ring lytic transglycosylase RlpA family protein [Terriglobia bacterium]|nr:septal ring lytic transglycosylase RlpA family protein [Terriglobia bacterium]
MLSRNNRKPKGILTKTLIFGALLIPVVPLAGICGSRRIIRRHPVYLTRRVQYGTASWYGSRSQGRRMACGQRFNEHAFIAAHRTLPLGTKVKVTNLRNGRSVTVKIKDRGPWVGNRLIDLSKAAAIRLRFVHSGLAPVEVRVLSIPKGARKRVRILRTTKKMAQRERDVALSAG